MIKNADPTALEPFAVVAKYTLLSKRAAPLYVGVTCKYPGWLNVADTL
ncbi:unknown [Clostridium sp. CAG:1013]|nr:unknown [Clostridium sp. CAG:1013]